jgi:phenylacetaldehyde dehydrogenase
VLPEQLDLIAGSRRTPAVRLDGSLENPNTGEAIAPRLSSSPEAAEEALAAADRAFRDGAWSGDAAVRADALDRLADALAARADELAPIEAIDSGVPIAVTSLVAANVPNQLRGAAAQLREQGSLEVSDVDGRRMEVHHVAWGPALAIVPWNAPLSIGVKKTANALAAGSTVILKPSERAPGAANVLATAVQEAGLPDGVFQLVHGDGRIGAQLASDRRIRAIAMTGGIASGSAIAAAAAPHMTRLQLELGGSNPAIVRADADVAATGEALARGITKLSGQWCEGPRRILVHESIHDDLVEATRDALGRIRFGSSLDHETECGPISHSAHLAKLQSQVAGLVARGGEAVEGGDLPEEGFRLRPTLVLGIAPEDALEEIFGPVVTFHPVAGDEAALAAANLGEDGLAGYVFSRDEEAALRLGRQLRGGEIKLNGTALLDMCPGSVQSFFGRSGIGGHGAPSLFDFFRGVRIVGFDDPELPF